MKPLVKPGDPRFSSGPCLKPPSWSLNGLRGAFLSRSHRSKEGEQKILDVLTLAAEILDLPSDYKIVLTPGSATGAITMAVWNMLGPRSVDVLCWDVFGRRWASDVSKLPLDVNVYDLDLNSHNDFSFVNNASDILFVWGGTSTGSSIGDLSWLSPVNFEGLTICDATSAAFGVNLPWEKLDVTCFSWQKVMGGEAAHGLMVLSPKAIERLESYTPAWPIPYLLNLKKDNAVRTSLFSGDVINTPSMLCLEDFYQNLLWAKNRGGLDFLTSKVEENYGVVQSWVQKTSWAENLITNSHHHSKTAACIRFKYKGEYLTSAQLDKLVKVLASENVAFDISGFKGVLSNLRIWTGPTISSDNLKILLEWIEWAYNEKVFL